ncbi:ImmA/IrrE family metallo-endopeptidase [Flavobacterium sp.]|uniref:ImmA/IrrE family metallo-endopeptidase n=1 Tax=Flavobacterium sp. TaxID=239 RepID=UPI00286D1559|nr:ImmA/IrrE family metallo-endopeptidase [Flavobacterium sp.]
MIQINSERKIKKLAEFIALKYDEKITPLEEIIKEEGLRVFFDNYEKGTFDGMTIYEDDNFFIHINIDNGNRIDSARGRFTLAHELGHYLIDSHRIGLMSGLLEPHPSKTNQKQFYEIEREADYFASCLLMPEERFKKDIFRKKFNFELIVSLSKEYNVSITACAFRFAQIGSHPIMIIYAENGIIKWTYYSEDFPYKYLLNNKKISDSFLMGEYFGNPMSDISKTSQIWAIDCFNYVQTEDSNKKFYEHCMTYKQSALSIIWED